MDAPLAIEWTAAAQFTWRRLSPDIQAGLTTLLHRLIGHYAHQYCLLADNEKAISSSPLIHVPEWTIWARFRMHYQEDDQGPILFIYEFEELSKRESELALAEISSVPNRLNGPDTMTDL